METKNLMNQAFQTELENYHQRYNPEKQLISVIPPKKNYHTAVGQQHTVVHNITASADYAVALFYSENPELGARVLWRILSYQDTTVGSKTYGIWPYNAEEPLESMLSPDWNMADFNAKKILHVLLEYRGQITENLAQACLSAVEHACESIIKRNIGPDYTNIHLMGACVTLLYGEVAGEEKYLSYGKERLRSQVEFIKANGNVTEYNSPTYGILALEEIGRILRYSTDAEAIVAATFLNDFLWKAIGEHYHKKTRQLSGPHSRCYDTLATTKFHSFLEIGTNFSLQITEQREFAVDLLWKLLDISCPKEYYHFFSKEEKKAPILRKETYYQGFDPLGEGLRVLLEKGKEPLESITYLSENFSLGTFRREDLWGQRRPLLAYFGTKDNPSYFRVRFLCDDYDFSGGLIQTLQDNNAVTAAISLLYDHGDYHFILTPLADRILQARYLAVRFELGGSIEEYAVTIDGNSILFAGQGIDISVALQSVIFEQEGSSQSVKLVEGSTDSTRFVDLVLYDGAAKDFRMDETLSLGIVFTVEVSDNGHPQKEEKVQVTRGHNSLAVRWGQQAMDIQLTPETYAPNKPKDKTLVSYKGGFLYQ